MSDLREPRKSGNEGSTLAEALGRYLERRRRDRLARDKGVADQDRSGKFASPASRVG